MSLQVQSVSLSSPKNAREGDEIYEEDKEGLCISIEGFRESEQWDVGESYSMYIKDNLESVVGKEKQISVDPISLKQLPSRSTEEGPRWVVPSITTTLTDAPMYPPLPLPPPKLRFLSSSLPSSATSSPRSGLALMKNVKKWRAQNQTSSLQTTSLARQHSAALTRFARQRESNLRRSKSCGEGRACAPSDEFDLWSRKLDGIGHENRQVDNNYENEGNAVGGDKNAKNPDAYNESFKCGAFCLFLPGFGKGKPVRARKEEGEAEERNVISRTVSLEKFECGSWSSSAIINDEDEEDRQSMNLYFDLPLELIRNSANDAHSPVSTAFVFDRDKKGALKKSSSRAAARNSHESSRHVRFSTTSMSHPTSPSSCITPRLRKARDDFNAFLQAQNA